MSQHAVAWLRERMRQAAESSKKNQAPILVLNMSPDGGLVVMRYVDFERLFLAQTIEQGQDKEMQRTLDGELEAELDRYVETCAEWSWQ